MKKLAMTGLLLALSGCADIGFLQPRDTNPDPAVSEGQTRPVGRPGGGSAPAPSSDARTVEEFDTTSAEDRQAAAAASAPTGEQALGSTVASLGDPARPGFWIETPLVSAPGQGRVLYPETGKSARVELIPIAGPATAGSRLSLAAMRLIGAPLTGLPEVEVYSGG